MIRLHESNRQMRTAPDPGPVERVKAAAGETIGEKTFRFGVVGCGATAKEYAECALRAERFGYSVFLTPDHLDVGGRHLTSLSAIPALAYAAAVTNTIRLGTSVINHDFHLPAVLAREIASLDILSEGRIELGLGAGWAEYEYEWAGLSFDPPRLRVDRFEEYVAVVKSLLSPGETSFEGEFFKINEMPGPSRPRPPLMIGGTGRRMLRTAVREADIVGINLNAVIAGTAERMDERIEWVREAAGGDLASVEINNIVGTVVVEDGDPEELIARELRLQKERGLDFMTAGMSRSEVLESPVSLVGSVDSVVSELEGWRSRWGVSYLIVAAPVMEALAPVVRQLTGR
jgi:probable F420-dependent oxidoreductase